METWNLVLRRGGSWARAGGKQHAVDQLAKPGRSEAREMAAMHDGDGKVAQPLHRRGIVRAIRMIGIVDQRSIIDDVAGQQDAARRARKARCRPANGRAYGSTSKRRSPRSTTSPSSSRRWRVPADRRSASADQPGRQARRTSRRSRSGRQASIRCAGRRGSSASARCTQRSRKLVMAADMVEMGVAGDADELLARSTSGTWRRRLTWPRPVSNSRSRSRPRTCQMLQRKNGLIQGSWIRVTPSPMRMVSYQSAASMAGSGHGSISAAG